MVKLSDKKKEILQNKLMDLANLIIIGISVTVFFTKTKFNWFLFLSGILLWIILYSYCIFFIKD